MNFGVGDCVSNPLFCYKYAIVLLKMNKIADFIDFFVIKLCFIDLLIYLWGMVNT